MVNRKDIEKKIIDNKVYIKNKRGRWDERTRRPRSRIHGT
jgi:hypothetical protein